MAIDPSYEELEETPEGPLKIVMDARDLKFLDNTFDLATVFFTMMYIEKEAHEKVFSEVYRVLKKDGEFMIWDITIPKYTEGEKDIYVFPLEVNIGNKLINTGYGTK